MLSQEQKEKYLRLETFPTEFCPGCSDGLLMGYLIKALDTAKLDFKKTVFISGIGCAGWITSPHFKADTLHTTHGRPLAFATGVRLARPDLNVIVVSGDGDLTSIGGNHLIHAARRNLNIKVICVNNEVYGMTGGQIAPTTPTNSKTTTTPDGSIDRPFDLVELVKAAGGGFVSRYVVTQDRALQRGVIQALEHPGFAFIEVRSTCPVMFGRRNSIDSAAEMLHDLEKGVSSGEIQTGVM